MLCNFCGREINDGSTFCAYCGASLAPVQPQPTYQQPTQPAQPTQPNYPTYPNYQQPTYPNYQQSAQPNYPNYQQPAYPNYQQQLYGQPMQPEQAIPANTPWNLSRKDFYNIFVSKKSKSFITWMAAICFFTAAISLVFLLLFKSPLGIVDIVVYVIFGALLLLTKHWSCALIPTLYSAVWTVVSLASGGTPSGLVALVVGINCVSVLFKADKAYKMYCEQHICPTKQI